MATQYIRCVPEYHFVTSVETGCCVPEYSFVYRLSSVRRTDAVFPVSQLSDCLYRSCSLYRSFTGFEQVAVVCTVRSHVFERGGRDYLFVLFVWWSISFLCLSRL
jgi:hypothetical protein